MAGKEKPNNYDRTGKKRMQQLRERMHALGFKRKEVWIHPDDWPAVKKLVNKLTKKRSED